MEEKSVVLIDGENILRSWWDYCNKKDIKEKIDYIKLINKLSRGTNLLRAYFYDGVPEKISTKKRNFLEALEKQGVQLRTKILKEKVQVCSKCKNKDTRQIQKGVDVSLATDILRHAWQNTCNVCIIVSGDEDYKDAIECAKDRGVKVWIASFKNSLSEELRRTADKTIFLENIFDEIKYKNKKRNVYISDNL